jgi:DNA repair exonuclease SbcCD ATPase subunit
MILSFKALELENFKGHPKLAVEFSDLTKISGKNGEGKSTIGDAFTWVLFGTDSMGNQLDPQPLNEYTGDIVVNVSYDLDGQPVTIVRAVENGTNKFYINETPVKATEFKEYVETLFNKEFFLSLYNPAFFSSQHWKKQREQLLQYVNEPLKKDVFAKMVPVVVANIEEPLKKHSLEDLEKIHRDRFNKRDKEYERAAERVLTLQEQLQKATGATDIRPMQKEYQELHAEWKVAKEHNEKVHASQRKVQEIEMKERFIRDEISKKKNLINRLSAEAMEETCPTCGQELNSDHKQHAEQKRHSHIESLKAEGKELVLELRHHAEMKEQLTAPGDLIDVDLMVNRMAELKAIANEMNRLKGLQEEIDEATAKRDQIKAERLESQGILDAIKAFNEEKSLLMVEQVNALFDTLSVKLFDKQKNGEYKHTFEIEMDGKPYCKLSTAEKIKAGLELIEVLQNTSGVVLPTFIDNAESILNFKSPRGQAIIAAVKNNKLKIEKVEQ